MTNWVGSKKPSDEKIFTGNSLRAILTKVEKDNNYPKDSTEKLFSTTCEKLRATLNEDVSNDKVRKLAKAYFSEKGGVNIKETSGSLTPSLSDSDIATKSIGYVDAITRNINHYQDLAIGAQSKGAYAGIMNAALKPANFYKKQGNIEATLVLGAIGGALGAICTIASGIVAEPAKWAAKKSSPDLTSYARREADSATQIKPQR